MNPRQESSLKYQQWEINNARRLAKNAVAKYGPEDCLKNVSIIANQLEEHGTDFWYLLVQHITQQSARVYKFLGVGMPTNATETGEWM